MLHNASIPLDSPAPAPAHARTNTGFGSCRACRRPVTLEDDFARVERSLYHLGCLFGALRAIGDRSTLAASLRTGIESLGNA